MIKEAEKMRIQARVGKTSSFRLSESAANKANISNGDMMDVNLSAAPNQILLTKVENEE